MMGAELAQLHSICCDNLKMNLITNMISSSKQRSVHAGERYLHDCRSVVMLLTVHKHCGKYVYQTPISIYTGSC